MKNTKVKKVIKSGWCMLLLMVMMVTMIPMGKAEAATESIGTESLDAANKVVLEDTSVFYSFQNVSSGWFMNTKGAGTTNRTAINLYPLDMSTPISQQYRITYTDSSMEAFKLSTYNAEKKGLSMSVDVRRNGVSSISEGMGIMIWETEEEKYQELYFEYNEDGSVYICFSAAPEYCIAAKSSSAAKTKQQQLVVTKKTGEDYQKWYICDEQGTRISLEKLVPIAEIADMVTESYKEVSKKFALVLDEIDSKKSKYTGKNRNEKVFLSGLEDMEEAIATSMQVVASAYERGYNGELLGNLKSMQESLEHMMDTHTNSLLNLREAGFTVNWLNNAQVKEFQAAIDDVVKMLEGIDLKNLLYELYCEGWQDAEESIELPTAYTDAGNLGVTKITDISDYVVSDVLAERLTAVFHKYNGNGDVYISNTGTRKYYKISGNDYDFYTNRYDANGNLLNKNFYKAVQCYGLALYTYDKLFTRHCGNRDGLSNELLSNVTSASVKSGAALRELFVVNGISTGAHIRTNYLYKDSGHSMILLAYDKDSVLIYEGNYDGYYSVRYCCMTWDAFYDYLFKTYGKIYHITMPKNYETVVHGTY